jgi:acetyl-CoA carboxylase biotin carboxylase subunit
MAIKKILIANRGEIACRIIDSCREMGIETIAVYSDADEGARHTILADYAIHIGPSQAAQSYLNIEKIINTALDCKADAIHPGYGFLSENPEFAAKSSEAGLIFIGPSPESMRLLGSKTASRRIMASAEVPIISGMHAGSKDIEEFVKVADEIGYPVLIKAAAGGGGKGMRIVRHHENLKDSIESAMRESLSAFHSDEIYLEKYIDKPRHIEFQIAADKHGNAVHLFERECSIQRRHQKIIEETPCLALNDELRKNMGEAALKAIKAANYDNIGTVEFLLDKNNDFYFLEINARIQVEHPITEMTTGIDLVKLQIKIAEGAALPFSQKDLSSRGHSIECRIYAEDPENNFMPSTGKIIFMKEPQGPGVRYDSGIKEGNDIPVFYDPILAKLVVLGENRDDAIKKMIKALKENPILGIKTSIPFMLKILENEEFKKGNITTSFIEDHINDLKDPAEYLELALAIASVLGDNREEPNLIKNTNIHAELGAWQLWRND